MMKIWHQRINESGIDQLTFEAPLRNFEEPPGSRGPCSQDLCQLNPIGLIISEGKSINGYSNSNI